VIDLGSRRVVGWATADYLRTDLIAEALNNAVTQRPESGVIFHFRSGSGLPHTGARVQINSVWGYLAATRWRVGSITPHPSGPPHRTTDEFPPKLTFHPIEHRRTTKQRMRA
jgi:transposase InsO family protein